MQPEQFEVRQTDLCAVQADAIVNPANSTGTMEGGVAAAIRRACGAQVEQTAMEKAPIPIGSAIITKAENIPAKFVIHAPTMSRPSEHASLKSVADATNAALQRADLSNVKTLAFPGMGTGVGGLDKKEATKVMLKQMFLYQPKNIEKIVLTAIDDGLMNAFHHALQQDRKPKLP